MISYNEIAPADDTEDYPMVLSNLHHVSSSEGLVEPAYLCFFLLFTYLFIFILLLFVCLGLFCLHFCNAFLSGTQLFELMLS